MKRQIYSLIAGVCFLVLVGGLSRYLPAQPTFPAFPRTYIDLAAKPVTNPATGTTTAYTRAGTICALAPSGTETCTGQGGGGVTGTVPTINGATPAVPFGPIYQFVTLSTTNYAWRNQSTSTLDTASTSSWYFSFAGNATDSQRLYTKAYPAGAFTFVMAISPFFKAQNTPEVGICIEDGTKLESFVDSLQAGARQFRIATWTNVTTFSANVFGPAPYIIPNEILFFQFADDGTTNRTWSFGIDGVHWKQALQESRTNFLTPTRIGICANGGNNSDDVQAQVLSIPN